MAKVELKNKENSRSVSDFISSVENSTRKSDAKVLLAMMKKITKEKPRMWGDSLIGFGNEHLKYDSGREVDWFKVGFSPRKTKLSLYLTFDASKLDLSALGKHKTGSGCIYINKLDDIDLNILEKLIKEAWLK